VSLIAFVLHNLSVEVLFCVIVLHLTYFSVKLYISTIWLVIGQVHQTTKSFFNKECLYLLKISLYALYAVWAYFIFLLLVFHKIVELNRHFTLKMYSDVQDSFISPN
jgi:hypothetical protein